MKRAKKFWVKERYNPQLGTHFYPMGQLSNTAAKACESALHGHNTMHAFETEAEADAFIVAKKEQSK